MLAKENLEKNDPNGIHNVYDRWVHIARDAYNSDIDSNKLRSSTGIAFDWLTPVGPLTFSFSQPITKASSDETETFRFDIGTSF